MPRRTHLRSAVTVALSGVLLSACGSATPHATPAPTSATSTKPAKPLPPLHVAAFQQSAGSAVACHAIMRDLPAVTNQQQRRRTTGSPFAAAWGDPAIVLRCGVPKPRGFNAYASCLTVNGIDWYLQGNIPPMSQTPPPGVLTVTTVYRKPAIQLVVPNHYGTQGPSTSMAQLTAVISAHTTASKRCL